MSEKLKINNLKENLKKVEEYCTYKSVTINHKPTLQSYHLYLRLFLSHINKETRYLKETDLIEALNKLNKKYKTESMNGIKVLIKSFLWWRFGDDTKKIFRNIDNICKRLRKERTYNPDQMLSKDDVEKLVKEEPETRWKAFLLLYFYGGFRPGEVCNLKWKDIVFDSEGAFVKVYVKKNGKSFEKYIPENVCFYLRKIQNSKSEYVFPTKRTNKHGVPVGDLPMTRSGVYQHLLPLAQRVLGKHVNPYILRHSIATILYNRDDLKDDDVAKQMGHSVAMRETYNNLSIDKIKVRMKKLYIEPEDLPPEKKAELMKEIEMLKERIPKAEALKSKVDSLALAVSKLMKEKELLEKKMNTLNKTD